VLSPVQLLSKVALILIGSPINPDVGILSVTSGTGVPLAKTGLTWLTPPKIILIINSTIRERVSKLRDALPNLIMYKTSPDKVFIKKALEYNIYL
jgi:hypothetical protein